MTSVSSDDMAQPDDMAGSAERLSPEALSPERTPVADTSDDAVDTAEEEEGICGRTEGCSPTPADEPTPSSAEEGKPDGMLETLVIVIVIKNVLLNYYYY